MAGLSDAAEIALLDLLFGNVAWPIDADLEFSLWTSSPSDSGGGTEVTGGSYARVTKTRNVTNFPTTASRVISNGTDITFPQATADWGSVVAVGFHDGTTGDLLGWQNLVTPRTVLDTNVFSFGIGQLDITVVTGGMSDYLALRVLNFIFNAAALTPPATYYLTQYRTNPDDADTGTEETGAGYSRTALTNNTTNFPGAAAGSTSNGTIITPTAPTGNWGPITHYGWRDANVAGNLWWYNEWDVPQSFISGDIPSVAIGGTVMTLD